MLGKARPGRINGESETEVEPQAPVVVPIARDASGDGRERFDAEALSHREGIYRAAHRLTGNVSDAEDLAQETYLQALRASHRFRLGTDLKAWLFTILRNLIRNRRRSAARAIVEFDGRKLDQYSELAQERETPEHALLKKADNAALQAAFESLPRALRDTLWLSDVEELPYAEIARRLSIPVGTVMSRVFRARKRLYARLAGRIRRSDRRSHPAHTKEKRSGTANRDSSDEG